MNTCSTDELLNRISASANPQEALSAIVECDPVAGMAIMFRTDPDGSAVVMHDIFRRMNTGISVGAIGLVAVTALVTWALCQSK